MRTIVISIYLLTFFTHGFLLAETPTIHLERFKRDINLSRYDIGHFFDPSKSINIDEVTSNNDLFERLKGNNIFSSEPGHTWISFKLTKNIDDDFRNYLLQIGNAHIAHYDIYIFDEIGLRSQKTQGDNFNYDQREVRHNFFVHNLPEVFENQLTIYLKIDQEGQELNLPLNIYESNYFIQHTLRVKMLHGVVIGLLLITSVVTFILFIVYKDKFFLYEVIVSIASIMYIISEEGYGMMIFWPNSPTINAYSRPIFVSILVIFSLLFTLDFLKIEKRKKQVHNLAFISIGVLGLFLVSAHPLDMMSIRNESNIGIIISWFLVVLFFNCALIALISLWAWIKEKNPDGFVVFLVFSVTLIAVAIRILAIHGYGSNSEIIRHTGFITRGIHIPLIGGYLIYNAIINFRENQIARVRLLEDKNKLTQSLIENRDAERQRISMALHDSAGSIITGIKANLQMIQEDHKEMESDKHYFDSVSLTDQLQQEIRNISNDLVPSTITKIGLVPEIKRILDVMEETYNISVKLESNEHEHPKLNEKILFHLYYIVREGLDNIAKYADASEVLVQYLLYSDEVHLIIEDNGTGFDVEAAREYGGNGLKNMELRVNWLGGHIDIYSEEGSSISINIPIHQAA